MMEVLRRSDIVTCKTRLQGSYRHAFFQDFPGLAKTKFQGFQGLKNPFSRTFQTRSIHKHGSHEVKNVHIQNQLSVYLHYSKEVEMQYTVL